MCLALPAEVIAISGEVATVDLDGVQTPVSLAFLKDVTIGDYVVVHVGYALSRIDAETAAEQLAIMSGAEIQAHEGEPA